jgi:plasmid stabilization system protein ParE
MLTFHKSVQREVQDICRWYDERKDRLGDEFFSELERTIELISANPRRFSPASFGRRKAHLRRFPFAIYYRVHSDRLRVLAVVHDKQHPLHAKDRT